MKRQSRGSGAHQGVLAASAVCSAWPMARMPQTPTGVLVHKSPPDEDEEAVEERANKKKRERARRRRTESESENRRATKRNRAQERTRPRCFYYVRFKGRPRHGKGHQINLCHLESMSVNRISEQSFACPLVVSPPIRVLEYCHMARWGSRALFFFSWVGTLTR